MSAYDGHFLLQFFSKVIHGVYDGKTVGVIPLNREKNLLLRIGNLVFVDSCQFLAELLDKTTS